MELNEVMRIALDNQRNLVAFSKWSEGIDKKIEGLEKSYNVLYEVQASLREFALSNRHFGEKMDDMKSSLESISNENKKQHEALDDRLKKLEDQPGDKWNKATWLLITAMLMAAASAVTKFLFP